MRSFVLTAAALLLTVPCAARAADVLPAPGYEEVARRLTALIEAEAADKGLPAVSIALVDDQKIVWSRGFGFADPKAKTPATSDTVYRVGSVSKLFTDIAVMQLVEQGKIALEAPVVRYLPYFTLRDVRARDITVREMLSHSAGMPDEENYHWDQPEYDDGALERYVRGLASASLLFAPGERFSYSNCAYEVLGDLIAKVTGQPFETYMRVHLLEPLQMLTSTFLKRDVPPQLASALLSVPIQMSTSSPESPKCSWIPRPRRPMTPTECASSTIRKTL